MELIIIAAISWNNVIGSNGRIPWRETKEDRAKYMGDIDRFRDLTTGHPVIMGRITYESIPQKFRPLPNRENIVLTRQEISDQGIHVAHSLEEAIEFCRNQDAYVIGGAQIYEMFLPLASRMEITKINKRVEGDTFFPKVDWSEWKIANHEVHQDYDFLTWIRKS